MVISSISFWDQATEELGKKVKIVLEFLSPSWLGSDFLFLDGLNNCKSVPWKYGMLPRKGLLKDRDQKIVGSSILIT